MNDFDNQFSRAKNLAKQFKGRGISGAVYIAMTKYSRPRYVSGIWTEGPSGGIIEVFMRVRAK